MVTRDWHYRYGGYLRGNIEDTLTKEQVEAAMTMHEISKGGCAEIVHRYKKTAYQLLHLYA
jgi:hypothetical protein